MLQFFLLLALPASALADAVVQDSLDGSTYEDIGWIHLHPEYPEAVDTTVTAMYERQPFTSSHLDHLKQLVESNRLYLWRVQLEGQPAVQTSIKAACFAEHLQDQNITLTLDERGHIISAQLTLPQSWDGLCSTSRAVQRLQQLQQLGSSGVNLEPTQVVVKMPAAGPNVPKGPGGTEDFMAAGTGTQQGARRPAAARTAANQQSNQEGAGDQQGQKGKDGQQQPPPPDTRTWWEKNWLFVMAGGAMVINILLKNAMGDLPQQGQQQRGAAAARPAARGR